MELVIKSEAGAWDALRRATSGQAFPDDVQIKFDGWPSFELDVKGRDWDSTVPTRVMGPLLEVQKDINRAYAQVRYSDYNLRRLREEERDGLEVVLKVEKGSSIFNAELWKQFSQIAEAAIGRMNGDQLVITVLGLALAIMAPVMFRQWLGTRQREKELENTVLLSAQETERLKVFAAAVQAKPELQVMRDDAQATHNRLLKAAKPEDTVSIKGVEIRGIDAAAVVQSERERSQEIEMEGVFVLLGNRTDKSDGFRITVRRLADGLQLNADVPIELPLEQQRIIQRAEWSKTPIRLYLSASILRDSVTHAVVTGAAEYVDAENSAAPPQRGN